MRNNLIQFHTLGEMLYRELPTFNCEAILGQIIKALGEGSRIIVPAFKEELFLTEYYWNPHHGKNPRKFRRVLDALTNTLGEPLGVVVFKRIVIELSPGQRLTVPYIECREKNCGACRRACFFRMRRNEMIRNGFKNWNYEEQGLLYGLHPRQIMRIVNKG